MKAIKRLALLVAALVAFAIPSAPALEMASFNLSSAPEWALGLAGLLLGCGAAVLRFGKGRQFSLSTLRKQSTATGTAQRLLTSAVTTVSSQRRATQLNFQLPNRKDDREALLIRTVRAC